LDEESFCANDHGIFQPEQGPPEVPMFPRSRIIPLHKTTRLAKRLAQPLSKHNLRRAARTLWPTFLALSLASLAHAQGTMDFSGATTLMTTFKTFAIYAGIRMMSGRFQDAIPGLFGALFGAGVLGWGAGWIGSLTGQTMQ
jgi:hypothetical protein